MVLCVGRVPMVVVWLKPSCRWLAERTAKTTRAEVGGGGGGEEAGELGPMPSAAGGVGTPPLAAGTGLVVQGG